MTKTWVDTDLGFDDLWALLLLRRHGCAVAGVSLVAGNAPLPQVAANAMGAKAAYGFDWPVWRGADRPLLREPETAERILGPTGMRSRGSVLPGEGQGVPPEGAVEALASWLVGRRAEDRTVLALGPLTNIATLLNRAPDAAGRISRLVWMGGSSGAGNHTQAAEYNAVADPEAAARVLTSGLAVDVVDLEFCRRVTFGPQDMPETDPLTADLLGGYLDIALDRGRPGMNLYDPLAALAVAAPDRVAFAPCEISVSTEPDESYGATRVTPSAASPVRLATAAHGNLASLCLDALRKEAIHGPGQ